MIKKLTTTSFCFIFILGLFAALPIKTNAQSASYTFRSTVMGSGIRQTGQYSYEITGERYNFSVDESPFFLTRIFNITNVNKFQFKHEVRSSGYTREIYSPVYNPNGNWWSEIYYWGELGKIPVGNYELITYISLNGGYYQYERTTNFSISGGNYYIPPADNCAYHPCETYPYYYTQAQNYTYNWTHIGKNIQKTGQYSYEIVNQTTNFNSNEDIYSLAMLSNITGIDTFQIKFDIYANGNRYIRTNEVPKLWPHGQRWESNYSWTNLGKLSNGYYEIRTHISVNGYAYVKLNTQTINVGSSCSYNCNHDCSGYDNCCYSGNTKCSCANHQCNQNCDYKPAYTFEWTCLSNTTTNSNQCQCGTYGNCYSFYSDENIKALTKFSNINNIGFFQVKHDLYYNGAFKREYLGLVQKPDYNYWGYNYTQSDLGKLIEGDYVIKTYVSNDGSSFKLVGSKSFNVKARRTSTQNSYHGHGDYCCDQHGKDYDGHYSNECTGYYSC